MKLFKAGLLLATLLASNVAFAQVKSSDLVIDSIKLDPSNGSTLKEQTPVLATIKFHFSKPASPLRAWVRIFDETYQSQYIGVPEELEPGTHVIRRGAYLTEPGTLNKMTVVFKDENSTEVFRQDLPVNYKFVRDPALDKRKRDGLGSSIKQVRLPTGKQASVKKGTFIPVEFEYDINTPNGLFPGTVPDTNCSMTHTGLFEPLYAKGKIQMGFSVGERCSIKRIKVSLRNEAERQVFEKIIDVDLTITD
ncbi:hypothetical protein [Duganella sp. Root1480D1]|uniref:hypothetical protein n=1 Tax=Duganella sp. Root1480D1 TaxID=1736471 RepID=UPI00070D8ED4|nr:hypothetical protein [Duganella sp. Root1480D1]KQZ26251.1 hypothetical protein ASD58_16540 [Duganella sp. Root1480D1]